MDVKDEDLIFTLMHRLLDEGQDEEAIRAFIKRATEEIEAEEKALKEKMADENRKAHEERKKNMAKLRSKAASVGKTALFRQKTLEAERVARAQGKQAGAPAR